MYVHIVNLMKVFFSKQSERRFSDEIASTKVGPKARVFEVDKILWPTF